LGIRIREDALSNFDVIERAEDAAQGAHR
jgi:hypothetical protein